MDRNSSSYCLSNRKQSCGISGLFVANVIYENILKKDNVSNFHRKFPGDHFWRRCLTSMLKAPNHIFNIKLPDSSPPTSVSPGNRGGRHQWKLRVGRVLHTGSRHGGTRDRRRRPIHWRAHPAYHRHRHRPRGQLGRLPQRPQVHRLRGGQILPQGSLSLQVLRVHGRRKEDGLRHDGGQWAGQVGEGVQGTASESKLNPIWPLAAIECCP